MKSHIEAANLLRELLTWSLNGNDAPRQMRGIRERVLLLTGRKDVLPELPAEAESLREKLIEILEDYMDG